MKTKFHILLALILFSLLFSCSEDEIPPDATDEASLSGDLSLKNFNYGMIKSYDSETIFKWNELLGSFIDEKLPIPLEAKIYAMFTISMHDALNNVVPVYETYALGNNEVDASDISKKNITQIADAAVSQAARDMMAALSPASTVAADALLNEVLSSIQEVDLKEKGVEIGKLAAQAMLQKRQGDFPFLFTSYTAPSSEPGVYQANFPPYMLPGPVWPANAVYVPNLGDLTPFGIESSDQFMGGAPYPVTSREYADDYNEIKAVGCANCTARTPEQTEIGEFWIENMASSINRLARTLILQYDLDGWEAARLIALLEMGVMDSFIASFREKAEFVFWAPITAIRAGDTDGNPETTGDATWNSMKPTPPVFEFPSTQAYGSGAASEIFRMFFKKDEINFSVTSPYKLPGVERSFSSFSEYSTEQSEARIFLGHHFRHSVEVGEQHGIELGSYVFENNFRKLKKVK
ncbi:vanadium-dependent haloperoxidase [Gramella jeungdoensis]|uniref:Vanadium-dependent haloperoxidase n=1 Tax=Gramella jeungdoensis TaxID=708091 RepID=A0ABT0YYN6_9FLAO|nr:vanadium-dependent haloperoxidase [Gramella jeungdoensis]MCM8568580.1 vanadium-dependent haloperoxidase [Gramella jeungdoensis]